MEVSQVTINPASSRDPNLLAHVTIVFDGEFVVRDMRLIARLGQQPLVQMPNRKHHIEDSYVSIAFACTRAMKARIDDAVLGCWASFPGKRTVFSRPSPGHPLAPHLPIPV